MNFRSESESESEEIKIVIKNLNLTMLSVIKNLSSVTEDLFAQSFN